MNFMSGYFVCAPLLLTALFFNIACGDSRTGAEADFPVVPASKSVPQFKTETAASGLEVVWSIVFAPDGRMFFTERPGRVRVVEKGNLRAAAFFAVPDVEL